jgi:hypothetical protein
MTRNNPPPMQGGARGGFNMFRCKACPSPQQDLIRPSSPICWRKGQGEGYLPLLALALGCIFMPMRVSAADNPRYAKPLSLPALTAEELVAVPLDSDVYAKSSANYSDLRLLDTDNKEVTFVMRRGQAKRTRKIKQVWAAENLALKPLDDGGLEITFRSDPKKHLQPPQGIRLITPLSNFEHHVRVESSSDAQNWQAIVDDGLVFDYSQFMDVRNLAIDLLDAPEERREHFRLTIKDVTQEQQSQLMELSRNLQGENEARRTERVMVNRQPFRIDRIELWHDEMRQDVVRDSEVEYSLTLDRVEQDAEAKQTHIYLKSRREPLTAIAVVTPARNFSRNARVEVPLEQGASKSWQTLANVKLSQLDFRTLRRESLALHIPETRAEEYRLVIENGDSPPLEVTSVTAKGHVYEAVFLAAAEGRYKLTYDGRTNAAPRYDTAALNVSLAEGFAPLAATLGTEGEIEAALEPTEPFFKRLVNDTRVMTAVIGVLVLILAAGLYRATRHLDQISES